MFTPELILMIAFALTPLVQRLEAVNWWPFRSAPARTDWQRGGAHVETVISEYVPNDHSRQVNSEYYVDHLRQQGSGGPERIMDLGCGTGQSFWYFQNRFPGAQWVGLDIADSPEVALRAKIEGDLCTFDGVAMPFPSECFDLIYCNQVLERVRYPVLLLQQVQRVLRPDGCFIGSTSHLEPYHSFSLWNFTPYGFCQLLEDCGLQVMEIRPSIDAITLIIRRGLGRPRFFSRWWARESPLNTLIDFYGNLRRKSPSRINTVKLLFCGQFCFLARKSATESPSAEAVASQ